MEKVGSISNSNDNDEINLISKEKLDILFDLVYEKVSLITSSKSIFSVKKQLKIKKFLLRVYFMI